MTILTKYYRHLVVTVAKLFKSYVLLDPTPHNMFHYVWVITPYSATRKSLNLTCTHTKTN